MKTGCTQPPFKPYKAPFAQQKALFRIEKLHFLRKRHFSESKSPIFSAKGIFQNRKAPFSQQKAFFRIEKPHFLSKRHLSGAESPIFSENEPSQGVKPHFLRKRTLAGCEASFSQKTNHFRSRSPIFSEKGASHTPARRFVSLILTLLALLLTTPYTNAQTPADTARRDTTRIHRTDSATNANAVPTKPRYPVARTVPLYYRDLTQPMPADLHNPENLKTTIEYDLITGMYIIHTRLGDMELGTPITLTPEQYQDYTMQQSMHAYYRQKNEENFRQAAGEKLNLMDMRFNIGAADRIFGPGGIRVKSQGTAEMKVGMKTSSTKNPSLPERSRSHSYFNFDNNVQLNMQATVGTKVNFGLNYNTQSSFDFDASRLNLAYAGDEDEIIKNIEAGNVSLNTNNSLIRGGAALFGVKAELQFGKLRVNALLAQQNSESRTITSQGGVQTTDFEINIDNYDDNRHFFLGYFFRDRYDEAMAKLPLIASSAKITKMEVWVTNKRGNYNDARDIVAFSDLGENVHIGNTAEVQPSGTIRVTYNDANTLYSRVSTLNNARSIDRVNNALNFLEDGRDYEKIESARLLSPSEYTYNEALGYISLQMQLQPDESLAVAYQYTYGGKTYQVGEFSTDNTKNTTGCLFVKLLKGVNESPGMPFWDLMMKNVYSLDAYSVQKDKFKLDIVYQSDTVGTYVYSIQEGNISGKTLLQVMNLDRLDANNEPYPNGYFDFVEGYTINPSNGRIFFPVVEPFGAHLRKAIGNNTIANRYVFQELYDSTKTVAQQIAEKNKFKLRGKYRASSASEINLGSTNIARGSVVVTAGGVRLTENVDYTVDYASGIVNILNESVLANRSSISVSLENQSAYNMQRKTMMGLDLNYEFSKNFSAGATVMHLSEMPLTTKTTMGDESINNTLWGANLAYKGESQWLTNVVDKLPLLNLTKPSQISFNAEFAHLIAGHYQNENTGRYSYMDDFESTQSSYDLLNPYPWALASVPYDNGAGTRFPEASLSNNIAYGKNRALFAWYYIDGIFTRRNSSLKPKHITDRDISNHYVRPVEYSEIYPNKDLAYNETNTLNTLNLAFYPNERGPYNLDADGMNPDGTLTNPKKRWGGMMRKLEMTDFEHANIEYVEFWMMDPFIYNRETTTGGDLYLNLGDVSEDILKDGKKFFENGLPVNGDLSQVDTNVWGKTLRQQSTVYAFDNTSGARRLQDVGFNGLSSTEEKQFPTYRNYVERLRTKVSAETWMKWERDPFSPINDPAGDDYHYFRGSDYDRDQVDILTRYKHYNGTEGNSTASEDSPEAYDISSKTIPDVEDLNGDNTMSDNERYYEYKISIRPKDMVVGSNHIINERKALVRLPNGDTTTVTWYQFKVPIKEYLRRVGSIQGYKSIRFMRLYMTDFSETTILRLGTFELVRGDWRTYLQSLANPGAPPSINGTLDVTSVNIEENGDREPVNYILPPGVTRMTDPSQPQLRQQNEQALSMKVTNLASQDARAIYKNTNYDMRRYKRMQLFVHAEKFINDVTNLSDGELSVFIRLGSDYKNNYYEYEVPLHLTSAGHYNNSSDADRSAVWPDDNMIDFRTEVLTNLKNRRNRAKREGRSGVSFATVYSEFDPDRQLNKISVVGNPSLAEVKTIMIGIRNNSKDIKSGEVWVNELRMTDFDEKGGWAANAALSVALSDLGTINAAGRITTAGFGNIDQSIGERSMDNYTQYAVAASIQLGKFFPEKTQVNLPLYYAYSRETISPEYNPLDGDIHLSDALDAAVTQTQKDSIKNLTQQRVTTKSIALNNVQVNVQSKTPMPYDPSNFSFSYAYNENERKDPETVYETTKNYQGSLSYVYTPYIRPFQPFRDLERSNGYTRYIKQFAINYLPSSITFQTSMLRNYYEIQLRDMDHLDDAASVHTLPVSFSSRFNWDRSFSIRWSPLSNLNVDFAAGTNARIEEPHVQVNKKLNRTDYEIWKDSVKKSIADLGTPLAYDQTFNVTYTLPLQYIPILDWVGANMAYTAQYNWDRGSLIDDNTKTGNTIKNQRQMNLSGSLNMQSLYNKSSFLKEVNQKYSTVAESNRRNEGSRRRRGQSKYEGTIMLSRDSGVIVSHGLMNKKFSRITARRTSDSSRYNISYKVLDFARIRITNRDSVELRITIIPAPPKEETPAYKTLEYASRFLMMIRRVNLQYTQADGMQIAGFQPMIGDWIGQANTPFGNAPGWGFAFGDVRESYVREAYDRKWLMTESLQDHRALLNSSRTLNGTVSIEPAVGMKIELNVNRVDSRDTEIQYLYAGMPTTYGGTFTMTTAAIGSAFSSLGNALNGYESKTFRRFIENRNVIASRLENIYAGTTYPNAGFLSGSALAGKAYDPEKGSVSRNSSDVLIPSFLAAYTGGNASRVGLSPFPSLLRLLPNWRISYDGLVQLPFIRKHFKTMTLSHQYRCIYSVGNYLSNLTWVGVGGDHGYIEDPQTHAPRPASPYDISSVNITESFSPLIGIDAMFINNVTAGLKYQKTRNLNLNVPSYQIVETHSGEFTISLGYKYAEFNKILKMRKKGDFSNDLTLRFDYSRRKTQSLIRKIENVYTQMTAGTMTQSLQFTADYAFSRAVTLRAYYDLQINTPLISTNSYPTSNSDYGLSIRLSLAQ